MNVTFVGWCRQRDVDWRPVVSAGSEESAFSLLREFVAQLGGRFVDWTVLPAGRDPRSRRRAVHEPSEHRQQDRGEPSAGPTDGRFHRRRF